MSGLSIENLPDSAMNGHAPIPLLIDDEAAADLPRIDPKRGVFITRSGVELEMSGKQVSSLILERIGNEGKPRIPLIEVTVLTKKTVEYHPQDAGYVAALAEWEQDARIKTMRYMYTMGVKTPDIPEEFIEDHRSYFPNATAQDMKYLYIASLIPDEDIEKFTEAVMGQTMPTQKGTEEAADSFRSDS